VGARQSRRRALPLARRRVSRGRHHHVLGAQGPDTPGLTAVPRPQSVKYQFTGPEVIAYGGGSTAGRAAPAWHLMADLVRQVTSESAGAPSSSHVVAVEGSDDEEEKEEEAEDGEAEEEEDEEEARAP